MDYNNPKDKIMYITLSPCDMCAKAIVNSGIKKVVYKEDYRDTRGVELLKRCGILINRILNILLIVSKLVLLLNCAHLLLFLLFRSSLLVFFFSLFSPFLLLFLSAYFVYFGLLFLLCVLWAVHPLDMRLCLVVLVHKGHYLIKFCFVLPFLFGVGILSPENSICLDFGNFNAG